MERIHFIKDGVNFCPASMEMTTTCSADIPFRFFYNHSTTTDPEKAFSRLQSKNTEQFYIQLNFKDKEKLIPEFIGVLEDNPYLLEDIKQKKEDSELAERFLNEVVIRNQIDQALDNRNEELFMELSSKLLGD